MNFMIIIFVLFIMIFFIWFFRIITEKYDYNKIVINVNKSPLIRRILPSPSQTCSKKIKVFNGYEKVDNLPEDTFNILIDMEPHDLNTNHNFDLAISTKKTRNLNQKQQLYVPAWSAILGESEIWSIPDLLVRRTFFKNKFCAYMYSNCNESFNGVKLREKFFNLLHSKKHVDAIGNCNHNTEIPSSRNEKNWLDNAVELYKPYKFVVAFENTRGVDGYVSEKIILPLLAGCVPIYSGDQSVREMFNPDCFINIDDFSSLEQCIEYILYVDSNDSLYKKYIQSTIIDKKRLVEYANWYYGIASFYDQIFENISEFKRSPYIPIYNEIIFNPDKNIKIINLDKSKNRWEKMQLQLKNRPYLRYERFSAIDGLKYSSNYKNYIQTDWLKRDFTTGEIGVYLSNMEIYYNLVNDIENDYYAIFEDDIIILNHFTNIEDYVMNAPKDWDLLFLGSNETYCDFEPTELYTKMNGNCMPGSFALIVKKRAAQYFLNFAFPIQHPIDEFYRSQVDNLNMYLLHPRVISTDYTNISTVHNTPGISQTH